MSGLVRQDFLNLNNFDEIIKLQIELAKYKLNNIARRDINFLTVINLLKNNSNDAFMNWLNKFKFYCF